MDNHGQPAPDGWITLTEAAARSGHSREALRQRVRRGSLAARKGNDGVLRLDPRDLADLPPPDASMVDRQDESDESKADRVDEFAATLAVLGETVADLRADLVRTRTALDTAQADRLADHGRAERAEAQATAEREKLAAETARASAAEARAVAAETALAEARTPWLVRVIRAARG
jgi:hypothetical protein